MLLQGPQIRPQLMTGSGMLDQTAQQNQQSQTAAPSTGPSPVSPGQQVTAAQADASGTTTVSTNVGGQTITIDVRLPADLKQATCNILAGIMPPPLVAYTAFVEPIDQTHADSHSMKSRASLLQTWTGKSC